MVDPLCLVEGVKRQLARKAGIPAEQRRLTFSAGGGSLSPWDAGDDTLSPAELGIETGCREEELAGECRSWRVPPRAPPRAHMSEKIRDTLV